MPKETYTIPGTNKTMIVEKDDQGHLKSVTDEKGKPAQEVNEGEMSITLKCGAIEATVLKVYDGTCLAAKHNPTCCWYFIGGKWYYICS